MALKCLYCIYYCDEGALSSVSDVRVIPLRLHCKVTRGKSVNRAQTDIEHAIFEPENKIISRYIFHRQRHTRPIASPMRRNSRHRSLFIVVSATSAPPFQPLYHQRNICHPVVNPFTRQTLPTGTRRYFFMNILYTESFCSQTMHNRTHSSVVQSSTVAISTTETSL
jgi:hypothetical protein